MIKGYRHAVPFFPVNNSLQTIYYIAFRYLCPRNKRIGEH